jgi:hypothetical protein
MCERHSTFNENNYKISLKRSIKYTNYRQIDS